jgi:hypothetical protein
MPKPKSRKPRRKAVAVCDRFDPKLLDDGIRDCVLLLRDAGFKTFTSCQGGRGHSFRYETIGLELEGRYADFEKRLVRFLRARGMQNFTISLTTDYNPDCPEGRKCVYLAGLDILSMGEQRRVIEACKRKARLAVRKLRHSVLSMGLHDGQACRPIPDRL